MLMMCVALVMEEEDGMKALSDWDDVDALINGVIRITPTNNTSNATNYSLHYAVLRPIES